MKLIDRFLEWDEALFLKLNGGGLPQWDSFFLFMSRVEVWIPLYVLLLFFLFRKYGFRAFLGIVGLVILTVLITDQGSVRLFKNVFERLRPCHVDELIEQIRLVKGSCGGKFGFVSSHAANTFGLAFLVGPLLGKRAWGLLFVWALVVSYSRIHLGVHYPADIAFGAIFGACVGFFMSKIFLTNRSQSKNPAV